MLLRQLFDRESSTYSYLVADERRRVALIIDPVLEQVEAVPANRACGDIGTPAVQGSAFCDVRVASQAVER